jgi:predicted nucleic acid-binding protein
MAGLGVVLDTNVLLSGLAYPASVPGRLIAAWRFGALRYPIRTPAEFWAVHGGL